MARKPKKAPTMMNIVPSGKFDVCMKGASEVSGTIGVTMATAPDKVGSPVAPTAVPELVDPADEVAPDVVVPVVVAPDVVAPVVVAPVVVAPLVDAVSDAVEAVAADSEAAALDRLGRDEASVVLAAVVAAIEGIANRDTARAVAKSGVPRGNFMLS
jgi:hypothetical protein